MTIVLKGFNLANLVHNHPKNSKLMNVFKQNIKNALKHTYTSNTGTAPSLPILDLQNESCFNPLSLILKRSFCDSRKQSMDIHEKTPLKAYLKT